MNILHAFWRPDPADSFVQTGDFHIWVETAAIQAKSTSGAKHPRHLAAKDLKKLLLELGLAEQPDSLVECALALPSAGNAPLPCPELLPFVEVERPESASLREWSVACWKLAAQPIASLNELHFQTLFQGQALLPGADFLFWHWFSQSLKALLFKDSYVPALRLKAVGQQSPELYAGWEFATQAYEDLIQSAAHYIPPSAAPGYREESLLRHCAEVSLHRSIRQASLTLTQALEKRVAGSLVGAALHLKAPVIWQKQADLKLYRTWRDWRGRLFGQGGLGFQLGLQLHEASEHDPDDWRLEFCVSARHGPSLSVSLEDYWDMAEPARRLLRDSFGKDFEQNLLLQLGQAARMYPALWEGLETDQPIDIEMNLEDAFGFLNETAWVLEDAGFRVIVPAWWTPQGRRRAKLKMRSAGKAAKTIAKSSQSSLSLESLLQYQYELTLGGENVSATEWE